MTLRLKPFFLAVATKMPLPFLQLAVLKDPMSLVVSSALWSWTVTAACEAAGTERPAARTAQRIHGLFRIK